MRIALRNLGIAAVLLMAGLCPVMAQGTVIAVCGTLASPLPVRSGQPLFLDTSGNLCIGGTISATLTFPTIGAAVPLTGSYNAINVAGTLRGITGLALGSTYSQTVAVVDASGNQVTSFGGTNASVSATGAAVPASATYAGINIGGNLTGMVGGHGTAAGALRVELPTDGTGVIATVGAVTAITNALPAGTNVIGHVICDSGCSSSTAPADASTFTPGTTPQSPIGGFYQTTATNNPLTNLQMGAPQLTATRALFTNLRNSSGAEIGVSGAEVFVGGRGTAGSAAGGVLSVQGVASMTPVQVSQATAASLNATVVGTGTFVTQATLAAETTKVIGTVNQGTSPWVVSGTVAFSNTTIAVTNAGTFAVQANVSAINGVTPLMGNGTTGTGSQRVTIASDNTAFSVNATLGTETTKVIGTVNSNQNSPYPVGATPYTATATGTTGATTATLAGASSVTTYLCGFSIRANATAAATGNATVTGVITATMNFTQWTAPNASGLGITEMIFAPCIPASGTNQSVAVVSAAPGTGGVVSVSAWGYKL